MDIFSDNIFSKKLNEKLANGGVVSFVTDTVWGVGCLPSNEKGVENIVILGGSAENIYTINDLDRFADRFTGKKINPDQAVEFTAVFTDMKITECMWRAHDGQQPDEE